jgi:hypothetical protein
MSRSMERITIPDLKRLGVLARADRDDLFRRKPDTGSLYSHRLFAVALCQGGALHYVDGKNGIKDFDVWSFYTQAAGRQFPPRRVAKVDFGDDKFGVTPAFPNFRGRLVDLIGRSIPAANPADPVGSLQRYLRAGTTKTARLLAQKAMILIEPANLIGRLVWPAP